MQNSVRRHFAAAFTLSSLPAEQSALLMEWAKDEEHGETPYADWLEQHGQPEMAAAVRQHGRDIRAAVKDDARNADDAKYIRSFLNSQFPDEALT